MNIIILQNNPNPFLPGQTVVCINDRFKFKPELSGRPEDPGWKKPTLYERLEVLDVNGEFVCFEKYNNQSGAGNYPLWFNYRYFAPATTPAASLETSLLRPAHKDFCLS